MILAAIRAIAACAAVHATAPDLRVRYGRRQRGNNSKVGYGRVLQACKLRNIAAANAEDAHQKQRQPAFAWWQQFFAAVSQRCQQHYAYCKINGY